MLCELGGTVAYVVGVVDVDVVLVLEVELAELAVVLDVVEVEVVETTCRFARCSCLCLRCAW